MKTRLPLTGLGSAGHHTRSTLLPGSPSLGQLSRSGTARLGERVADGVVRRRAVVTPADVAQAMAAGRAERGLPTARFGETARRLEQLMAAMTSGVMDASNVTGSAHVEGAGTSAATRASASTTPTYSAFLLSVIDASEHATIQSSAEALNALGDGLWSRVHDDAALHARLFQGTATAADRGQLTTWTREIVQSTTDASMGAGVIGFLAATFTKYVLTTFIGYVGVRTMREKLHATEATLRAQVADTIAANEARAAAEARADARPPLDPLVAALLDPAAQLVDALKAATPLRVGPGTQEVPVIDVLTMLAASQAPAVAAVLEGLLAVAPQLRALVEAQSAKEVPAAANLEEAAEAAPEPVAVAVAAVASDTAAVDAEEPAVDVELQAAFESGDEAADGDDAAADMAPGAMDSVTEPAAAESAAEPANAAPITAVVSEPAPAPIVEAAPAAVAAVAPTTTAAPAATETAAERAALLARLRMTEENVAQTVATLRGTFGPRGADDTTIEAAILTELRRLPPGRSWRTASSAITRTLEAQFPL